MIKEACVENFDEALLAERRGADRIELCSDLASEGLTPSPELMQKTCSALKIPVMVMIRPRAGNFVHSEAEINRMKKEIDLAKQAGAAGVVFGILTEENTIDTEKTKLLAKYAFPLPVTFHKAIDELGAGRRSRAGARSRRRFRPASGRGAWRRQTACRPTRS